MRVSSTQIVYRYQRQLNNAFERQTKLMESSDGGSLHRPSDDPVAYSKYLTYNFRLNENEQYQKNVGTGLSWMRTSNSTMSNMADMMKTLKEKTVNAATETNEGTDYDDIAKEFEQYLNEVVALGNTQLGDRYIFAGQMDNVQPFSLSTEKKYRGLTKTLDDEQNAFFKAHDDTHKMGQFLTLEEVDADGKGTGNFYYLDTIALEESTPGSSATTKKVCLYEKEFVDSGYKDKLTSGQTQAKIADAADTLTGKSFDISKYFKNTGEIKDKDGTITTEGGKKLKFTTVYQHIVTYNGDDKYISMVKQNGYVDQKADTVNVTGQDLFGSDLFDDVKSGDNQRTIKSNGTVCHGASGAAMLNNLYTVLAQLQAHDSRWMSSDGITIAEEAHSTVLNAQTTVGAREGIYNDVHAMLETQNTFIKQDLQDVSSADIADMAVKLMEAETIYNMALSVGARILPQSLADYL